MAAWWDRKWRLVIFIIMLPIWLVPVISLLLFPEVPLIRSVLYGVFFSLLIAIGFWTARIAKAVGLRLLIVMLIIASLIGLLIGLLSKLL